MDNFTRIYFKVALILGAFVLIPYLLEFIYEIHECNWPKPISTGVECDSLKKEPSNCLSPKEFLEAKDFMRKLMIEDFRKK